MSEQDRSGLDPVDNDLIVEAVAEIIGREAVYIGGIDDRWCGWRAEASREVYALAARIVRVVQGPLSGDSSREALVGSVREEALRICGERIAQTQRHVVPGKMPIHGGSVHFSDDDVRMDDVLSALGTVLGRTTR